MLLAYASVVHQTFGRWGTDKLRLFGQDIDTRCVNMCRIQLRMNGLDGVGRMAGLIGACTAIKAQEPGQMMLAGITDGQAA